MKSETNRAVAIRLRQQYGVISRSQLRALGVTSKQEAHRVASAEWERPTSRVIRLGGSARSAHQDLMIALLDADPAAVASHQSAAWLWDLIRPPDRHSLIIGDLSHARRGPYTLHRVKAMPTVISWVASVPCTNPLRTLVDLAGVCSGDQLDDAVDRAVARKLVTVDGLRAELDRVARPGRNGAGAMRAALRRRHLVSGPAPSVLESRLLRLLHSAGMDPLSVEVVAGPSGEYRIDCLLDPLVALEVDGHVHHSTPEQKAYDEQRRAQLRLGGIFILVYDWVAVTKEGRRVIAESRRALSRYGSPAAGRLATR